MNIKKHISGERAEFVLTGKFTFSDHSTFRAVIDTMKSPDVKQVDLDFGGVDFIDSAALGMLLVAREESKKT